jgi:hypothetical protein
MIDDEISVNLNLLYKAKLSFEAYFLMLCVLNKDSKALENYVVNCRPIPDHIVEDLIRRNYITIGDATVEKLIFKDIRLSDKAFELLGSKNTKRFLELFNEFRAVYPKKGGNRTLQLDLARCRKSYEKIIMPNGIIDEALHKQILVATRRMVAEKERDNSLAYLQLMGTYLNQRNFEAYMMDEVEENCDDGREDLV